MFGDADYQDAVGGAPQMGQSRNQREAALPPAFKKMVTQGGKADIDDNDSLELGGLDRDQLLTADRGLRPGPWEVSAGIVAAQDISGGDEYVDVRGEVSRGRSVYADEAASPGKTTRTSIRQASLRTGSRGNQPFPTFQPSL